MKDRVIVIGSLGVTAIIVIALIFSYASGPDVELLDVITDEGDYGHFYDILNAAGLIEDLAADGSFTIFVPTDKAFDDFNDELYGKLDANNELLESIVRYHILEGKYSVADISKSIELETLSGEFIGVTTSGDVMVNGTKISNDSQVECKNGYIIAVDEVFIPPTINETYIDLHIVDAAGRDVYIKKVPERIVTIASSATETIYAIGAGDLLVGRDKYSEYPVEALELPNLGSGSSLALEETLNLEPDLAITWYYSTKAIESLEENGVNVIAIGPSSVQDVLDQILLFGQICGHQEEANSIVTGMQASITNIESYVSTLQSSEKVKVYYELSTTFKSVNNNTFTGQLIEMAGGTNITGDSETKYPQLSSEWIIDQNPNVIVVVSYGSSIEEMKARDGWNGIDAVIDDKVYAIESNWVSATPRMVLGLEQLAKWFYPEHFT